MSDEALSGLLPELPVEIRAHPSPLIQEAIDHALARMPPEHRIAVVGYADNEKVRGAVYYNVGGGFSLVGIVEKEYDRSLTYAAELFWSR